MATFEREQALVNMVTVLLSSPILVASVSSALTALIVSKQGVTGFIRADLRPATTKEDEQNCKSITLKPSPYETGASAEYYSQTLNQAAFSYGISVVAAVIGFGVILWGVVGYAPPDFGSAGIRLLSGTIISAVSGLFFKQSNDARLTMLTYFEKLRVDRGKAVALELINQIEGRPQRDQLRAQLALKYAEVDKLLVHEAARIGYAGYIDSSEQTDA